MAVVKNNYIILTGFEIIVDDIAVFQKLRFFRESEFRKSLRERRTEFGSGFDKVFPESRGHIVAL
jgi:hypothetical protein